MSSRSSPNFVLPIVFDQEQRTHREMELDGTSCHESDAAKQSRNRQLGFHSPFRRRILEFQWGRNKIAIEVVHLGVSRMLRCSLDRARLNVVLFDSRRRAFDSAYRECRSGCRLELEQFRRALAAKAICA